MHALQTALVHAQNVIFKEIKYFRKSVGGFVWGQLAGQIRQGSVQNFIPLV